jgi:uncharacterized protein with HEPN domain
VVRSIETMEEAAENITQHLRENIGELYWMKMTGMRGKFIHAYFGIDTETIYKAAKTNIPSLKQINPKILKKKKIILHTYRQNTLQMPEKK